MERAVRGHAENLGIFALEGTSGSKTQHSPSVDGETKAQDGEVTWPGPPSKVVAGSGTLVLSQGPFEGARCPFWLSVCRSLCPNSTFGKTYDISIQWSWSPKRCLPACSGPRSQALPALPPEAVWPPLGLEWGG